MCGSGRDCGGRAGGMSGCSCGGGRCNGRYQGRMTDRELCGAMVDRVVDGIGGRD